MKFLILKFKALWPRPRGARAVEAGAERGDRLEIVDNGEALATHLSGLGREIARELRQQRNKQAALEFNLLRAESRCEILLQQLHEAGIAPKVELAPAPAPRSGQG